MDDILQFCLLVAGVRREQYIYNQRERSGTRGNSKKAKKWRDLLDINTEFIIRLTLVKMTLLLK